MAWALTVPYDFGDFFPDGDYVGFKEKLHKYFNEEMDAEQKALLRRPVTYARFVGEKFISELGSNLDQTLPPVSPIASHEVPECFETEKRYSSLGSLIELNNRFMAVDDALKDIIERLEPEKHQFFPIKITMPNGEVYPKRHFTMIVGQWLESFSPEKSTVGCWKDRGMGYYSAISESKKDIGGLALIKNAFGKAHLWRERKLQKPDLLFSDELKVEIAKAGLRLPEHAQAKEV